MSKSLSYKKFAKLVGVKDFKPTPLPEITEKDTPSLSDLQNISRIMRETPIRRPDIQEQYYDRVLLD